MSALTRQLAAMNRLLVESGDLTPTGQRQIAKVLKQHADDQSIPKKLISDLKVHLDIWERHEHTTVGIAFLRNHFGLKKES